MLESPVSREDTTVAAGPDPFDLSGRCALVTGASRGIGREIALALARRGADVAVNARDQSALQDVCASAAAIGVRAVPIPADLTDRNAACEAVNEAIRALGYVDIVVNGAGGATVVELFTDGESGDWAEIFHRDLDPVLYVLQAVAEHLLERGKAAVVNVASVGGLAASPANSAHGAAKAAVLSLTRSLAVEWAYAGVRVNSLCPGWTATDLTRTFWQHPETARRISAQIPLGRWGLPSDMAAATVFLASDAASFITGHALIVDGGQLIWLSRPGGQA